MVCCTQRFPNGNSRRSLANVTCICQGVNVKEDVTLLAWSPQNGSWFNTAYRALDYWYTMFRSSFAVSVRTCLATIAISLPKVFVWRIVHVQWAAEVPNGKRVSFQYQTIVCILRHFSKWKSDFALWYIASAWRASTKCFKLLKHVHKIHMFNTWADVIITTQAAHGFSSKLLLYAYQLLDRPQKSFLHHLLTIPVHLALHHTVCTPTTHQQVAIEKIVSSLNLEPATQMAQTLTFECVSKSAQTPARVKRRRRKANQEEMMRYALILQISFVFKVSQWTISEMFLII